MFVFQARSSLCIQDITMARHPMREVILSASYDESDEVRCHDVPTFRSSVAHDEENLQTFCSLISTVTANRGE